MTLRSNLHLPLMIIDVHSHCFMPNSTAKRAIAAMARAVHGELWPIGDGTLKNQLDQMEHDGIDMACMLPIATKPTQHDVLLRNALALRDGSIDERSRWKIHPFMSVHPADPELDRHLDEIASLGFRGIKVHPYYQEFALDDPKSWPFFEKIAARGFVVECHCGFDVGYPSRSDACGPCEVAILLRNVPGLKFIAAHLAGCAGYAPHATDELLELGCYADTSALSRDWMKDEQMRLLRSWPTERLLFGTDFPWVKYDEAVRWVTSIRKSEDLDAIFSGNARRLLGM